MKARGLHIERRNRLAGIGGADLERAGGPARFCGVRVRHRETGWGTTVATGRNNAENWRATAVRKCAGLLVTRVATCVALSLSLFLPASMACGQHGGGRAAAPHMAAPRPAPARRSAPRNEAQQQRQFERQQQRAPGGREQRPAQPYNQQRYGQQRYEGAQQNYARPNGQVGGQAGTPRPAYNGAGGAARPEYSGAGNVRPAMPQNSRPYAFPPGHLGSWMNQHQNLSGQEQLLRNDPSFNRLPAADQQRLMQQLRQVNRLPADERERRLARAEKIEHMTPEERGQLAQSTRELKALPADRQARVSQAFRDLRGVPVDQRQTVIDSDRYQSQFSPEERGILTNLLRAEPYEPAR
jgi:Protein of unknown function (DUF3106)